MELLNREYALMREKVTELLKYTDEIEREIEKLCDVVAKLCVFWDSQASNEFVITIQTDMAGAITLVARLKRIICTINEAVDAYQEAEKAVYEVNRNGD